MFDWLRALPPALRDALDTWRYERRMMHHRRHHKPLRPAEYIRARAVLRDCDSREESR